MAPEGHRIDKPLFLARSGSTISLATRRGGVKEMELIAMHLYVAW